MNAHALRRLLYVLAVGLSASAAAAQSDAARTVEFPLTLSAEDWTALTLAPDGSFGAATHAFINGAIAGTIAGCRAMSRHQLGCGALLVTVQAADAERIAARHEAELREFHVADLPACRRILTIDPAGRILLPKADPQLASTPGRP